MNLRWVCDGRTCVITCSSAPLNGTSSTDSGPPTAVSRDIAKWSRVAHEHEQEDPQLYEDTDLQGVEEHKSVILQLLSQLKLGMDLTKVVLPTFILEKRSLLELFADCMAHPQLFLRVTDQPDAEARMLAVLEWYLTSFHAGRQVRAQVRMHTTHARMKSLIDERLCCNVYG